MIDKAVLTILIADDTATDLLILETIVRKEGHRPVAVTNGLQAVEAFTRVRPDLVLLDALMPEMDGFEAARQIKALAGEEMVPLIFLTSLHDTDSLVRCLEAGGDDFLSKPYNRVILQAKIRAFSRMRQMHSTMRQQRNQIQLHHQHMLQEQAVAKQVFDNIAHQGCLGASNIRQFMSPMAVFNGDVLVGAFRPSGSMLVLLGDFTGHGLPAAIGAMPLASTFYGMAHKGFSLQDILREINQKLKTILPIGLFCCATLVELNFEHRYLRIWNGGLPHCYLYRQRTGQIDVVQSTHLPLGVVGAKDFKDDTCYLELEEGDRLFLWTDGIHEARDPQGEMFGEERLRAVFDRARDGAGIFDDLLATVQAFVAKGEPDDDLSLVELRMATPDNLADSQQQYAGASSGLTEWALSFEVKAVSFRYFDPLPMLLDILQSVPGLRRHASNVYTILAELFSNALEHGVLELDSKLKDSPDGFERYYALRQERLSNTDGSVTFNIKHVLLMNGGQLTIGVKDTGKGFDYSARLAGKQMDYSGRGLDLLSNLADSVTYRGTGNEVEVVYLWQEEHGRDL